MTLSSGIGRIRDSHSYGYVLGMVLLIVVLTIALPAGQGWRFILVLVEAATLLVAVWTSRSRPRTVRFVTLVAIGSVVLSMIAVAVPDDATVALRVITLLLIAGLPFILTHGVVDTIRTRGVAINAVAGVLTLYLLLGLFFGTVYLLVNDIGSAAFFANHSENVRSGDFMYFAFVTQTTVGYGDFVPATDVGRALASCQAVVGQMYLVTVVAVVISHLGRAPRGGGEDAGPQDA